MKKLFFNLKLVLGVTVALGLSVALAYTFGDAKWTTSDVTFRVNPTNQDVSDTAAINAIKAGAAIWSTQSNAHIHLTYGGTTSVSSVDVDGTNAIFFRNATSPEGSGVIASTYTFWLGDGELFDVDMVFWDGPHRFYTGTSGCSSGYYIEDVAAHEFGHFLGLGHSSVSSATMSPFTTFCSQTRRTLASDDISGIQALYPPVATPTPTPTPTVKAPSNLTATKGTNTGTIKLAWADNSSNETGFKIERSVKSGSGFSQVATVGANVKTYVSKGMTSGKTYYFRVRAYKSTTNSSYSNTAHAVAK